jgi:hypothetical protein
LFLGRTPALVSRTAIMDARAAIPADFAWATVVTSAQLPPTPTPPGQPPAAPPEPMLVPVAIEAAVNALVGAREVTLDAPDTALKVMTRRLKDANVYLFFNEGAQATEHTVTLNAGGKMAEVWDPQTGEVAPVTSLAAKGGVTVKVELKPHETELLMVR